MSAEDRARIWNCRKIGNPALHLFNVAGWNRHAVDCRGGGPIATAEAGHFMYLDVTCFQLLQSAGAFLSAGEPARHVPADGQFDPRRRCRSKVRIEADEFLQAIKRNHVLLRQFAKPGVGQKSGLLLRIVK